MTTEEKMFLLTGAFEGGGYTNLTGSFDKMGISHGILQWNLGKGTLQPLLLTMAEAYPLEFIKACTVDVGYDGDLDDISGTLLKVCKMKPADAVKWAEKRQDEGHRFKKEYRVWVTVFNNLGNNPHYQAIQRKAAQYYVYIAWKYFKLFGFTSERGLALCFDIAVQMGGITTASMKRFRATDNPKKTEIMRLAGLALAVAPQAGRWSNDVLQRKLCIAKGAGIVHGRPYNLERDFDITMRAVIR